MKALRYSLKIYMLCLFLTVLASCVNSKKEKEPLTAKIENVKTPVLNLEEAMRLVQLPLNCMETEYPNRLSQTLGGEGDLQSPKRLHPAFYGCFDWHSAVHGHWSLVRLLKQYPEMENASAIKEKLLQNISKTNIKAEVAYFMGEHNKSHERTYGWAWLLKLAEELYTWQDPVAMELDANLKPLTDLIVEKYIAFLPKLNYPLRVGTHTNTAFGLSFAFDYAKTTNNEALSIIITQRAKDFYLNDANCPMSWEPGGYDFLSPCLEEAALMKRILPSAAFEPWLASFLPQLKDVNFELDTGKVSDREDGSLVHLDGVNFSRAWSFNKIAEGLPEYHHLKNIANQHINYSLPNVVDDHYEGGHWLGSFAIYALNSIEK